MKENRIGIEELSSELNGNVFLLESIMGSIESECIDRGWGGSSQAEWFLEKMRSFHMTCLNQILKRLLEIDEAISAEVEAMNSQKRTA